MSISINIAHNLRNIANWLDPYFTMGSHYRQLVYVYTTNGTKLRSYKIKGISIAIPEGSIGADIVSFEDTFLIWYDPCGRWIPARANGKITGWSTLDRWEGIP